MKNNFTLENDWRRTAAAIYKKPTDSKILGTVELDVTDLEVFVQEKRKQGLRITIMHPFILMVARALREEVPELNCYIRRGRMIQREHVDAAVSVLLSGAQMSSVIVRDADQMTLADLAEYLVKEVNKSRKGQEGKAMGMKALLGALPWPFRGWVLSLIKKITIDWGISMPALGMTPNTFGSFMFSNIGSLGLDIGYPALLPAANIAMVMVMGSITTKPAVVDGAIVPRRILNLSASFDHRVIDGSHGGKLFLFLKKMIQSPELLEKKPG